jgi:hypothetical protein
VHLRQTSNKIKKQRIGLEKATELLRKDPHAKTETGSENTDALATMRTLMPLYQPAMCEVQNKIVKNNELAADERRFTNMENVSVDLRIRVHLRLILD